MKTRKFTKTENKILKHTVKAGELFHELPEQGEAGTYDDLRRLLDLSNSIEEIIMSRPINEKYLKRNVKKNKYPQWEY